MQVFLLCVSGGLIRGKRGDNGLKEKGGKGGGGSNTEVKGLCWAFVESEEVGLLGVEDKGGIRFV
jgi:hypothetical protein